MAHFVLIEDTRGELIDVEVYCSDFCAQHSTFYAGWYGAQEVEFDAKCQLCKSEILGSYGEYEG